MPDLASVQDTRNDRLTRLRPPGPSRVRPGAPVRLGTAAYDPASRTVTLTPRRRRPLDGSFLLTVNATAPRGLHDTAGRLLVGTAVIPPGGVHLAVDVAYA